MKIEEVEGRLEGRCRVRLTHGVNGRIAAVISRLLCGVQREVAVGSSRVVVNGKEIMGLLTLAISDGDEVLVRVEGTDAEARELLEKMRIVFTAGDRETVDIANEVLS